MLRRNLCIFKNGHWLFCFKNLKLHTSSVLHSRFEKGLPNPNLPIPLKKALSSDTDILLEQLKLCKSLDRTLELISMHLDVMNSKHIVACFQNIHNFTKDDAILGRNLLENIAFQSLCTRLMKVIRLFDAQEVISTYKVFCVLQVRSNTYVMQCVLKMLGAHLNNMSLGQLTFLNFLLHKQRHNSLVDGLKLALPLVLQVQIDHQLDSDNLTEVVNCLQLCCRSRLKPATIEKVVKVIIQKASILSTDNAVTIIISLLNLETPVDGYKELINAAFEIVSKNVNELSKKQIITIVGICRSQYFYHSKFFYTVADHIVSKKWNLDSTYSTVMHFQRLEFFPSNLLDHFTDVLCSESKYYKTNGLFCPLSCIEYLTASSYKPKNIDEASRILYSEEKKLETILDKFPNLKIKFLSCLSMLGHFPPNLLSKAIDEDYMYNALSCSKKQGRNLEYEHNVVTLSWALDLYEEQKNFNLPTTLLNKLIQSIYKKHINTEYPLTKFIENGLGGAQFLKTGVFTEDGHVIDHIVAMRNGNYPVSLQTMNSNRPFEKSLHHFSFIEDFILPEDAKIIAIIVAKDEHYCRDPEILKGWMDLKLRNLAKKNYCTVVINYTVWENLPDREKIPFLMREIKQVIQDDCKLKNIYS